RVAGDRDSGNPRRLLEAGSAPVQEQARRAERVGDEKVREAVSVDVARRDAGRGDAFGGGAGETHALRDVREAAGPVVLVQDRAHAVADEEAFVAVAIEVEDRDARTGPDPGDQPVRSGLTRIAAHTSHSRFP